MVHPTLHEYDGLLIIDGARRVVAHVEAGMSPFTIAVIKRASTRLGGPIPFIEKETLLMRAARL